MEKKGLSEVISVTLLILMVIVVGVSIYSFSSNVVGIQKKQMNSALNPNLGASIDDIAINPTEGLASSSLSPSESFEIIITVTRTDNEDKEISGIRFIFTDKSGNNYLYNAMDPPEQTGVPKQYKITNTQLNKADFSGIEKVSLGFILTGGGATGILAEKTLE